MEMFQSIKNKKMEKRIVIISMLLVIMNVNAQWGSNKVNGTGNIATVERPISSFTKMKKSGFFDVQLIKSNNTSLKLIGEENLLKHVVTKVENNKLILKIEKGYNLRPTRGNTIMIQVPFKKLNQVYLSGSGDLKSKDVIKTNSFDLSISGSGNVNISIESNVLDTSVSGSGDLEIKGKTNDFSVSVSGSSEINAEYLRAKNVKAYISGSGSMTIDCEQKLIAKVSGSGEINYKGTPSVTSKISGSGVVSKI